MGKMSSFLRIFAPETKLGAGRSDLWGVVLLCMYTGWLATRRNAPAGGP